MTDWTTRIPGRDIWRVGLVKAPIGEITRRGFSPDQPVHWLPEEGRLKFLADPFGVWRNGRLHLFVEAYDYRTRHGVIELIELGADFAPVRRAVVLREPWHLSYPQVFEADGETWMLPEAYRSGALTLYRAAAFPHVWEPVVRLALDTPAIDATPFRHDGLWWLAYSPTGPQRWKQGRLHFAFAERLTGPWRTHPGNPVRNDLSSSRPGGSAWLENGVPHLPVQDCTRTYGGALRVLKILELSPRRFEAEASAPLVPPSSAGAYRQGLHTLSACGPVTLFDVKRVDRSVW
ncbi:glucosamine inositolphosphorylceramide transferase family protein [Caulobacter sp.]|uniref:glucosamine inositolphosphorylceramide transferase family protein n=1 Tax=Caulobacter sp. TaxID=78 RepID=UPI003BAF5158